MKIKNVIILLLLLLMNTSLLAEHLIGAKSKSSCTYSVHLGEHENLTSHDTSNCEVHCDLHHAYVLPVDTKLPLMHNINSLTIQHNSSYLYQESLQFFKPPIS